MDKATKIEAVRMYAEGKELTSVIAAKFGVTGAAISNWAKATVGMKMRSRGRRKKEEPTARERLILSRVRLQSYRKVGPDFGLTHARIGAIVKRWRGWEDKQKIQPPFAPGDKIEYRGRLYTVVKAGPRVGTVKAYDGRVIHNFRWAMSGHKCRKVTIKDGRAIKPV